MGGGLHTHTHNFVSVLLDFADHRFHVLPVSVKISLSPPLQRTEGESCFNPFSKDVVFLEEPLLEALKHLSLEEIVNSSGRRVDFQSACLAFEFLL